METIHYHFETLPSTNLFAKENVTRFNRKALTVVTAGSQTAGYGQLGKKWFSPPEKNLYVSFCLFVDKEVEPFFVTQKMAAILQKLLLDYNVIAEIKWPNDLLVSKKKIAGILTETVVLEEVAIIIGIGLNVNLEEKELQGIDQPATSLFIETGKVHSIHELLEKVIKAFKL